MIQLFEPFYLLPFLDATIGTPEVVGLAAVAMAALGVTTLVIKSAADERDKDRAERREERAVREKEAAAQQALMEALKAASQRDVGRVG